MSSIEDALAGCGLDDEDRSSDGAPKGCCPGLASGGWDSEVAAAQSCSDGISVADFRSLGRQLIDAYFGQRKGRQLIKHQLDSFDDFISRKLELIIDGFNPVDMHNCWVPEHGCYKHILSVTLTSPTLSKPTIVEKDGSTKVMLPNDARLRNLTYAAPLTVDVTVTARTYSPESREYTSETKRLGGVSLGRVPIMVRSKYCMLEQQPPHLAGGAGAVVGRLDGEATVAAVDECRYDYGGYFIINGNEKAVISQDRIAENRTYVFQSTKATSYSLIAEIRSVQDTRFGVPKTTALKLTAKANQFGRCVRVGLHHIRHDVPLFIVFRALGVISDCDIVRHIVQEGGPDTELLTKELVGSADEASGVHTQEAALEYMVQHLATSSHAHGQPKDSALNPAHRLAALRALLRKDVLPHVGPEAHKKALYLGHMAARLLRSHMGLRPLDDRDAYTNKRLDTPGVLLANLFRQHYGRVIKDMRTLTQKDINGGSWRATHKLINVITKANVYKIVKSTVIEAGLKYGLATGNWGVKTSRVRQGVAQILSRMTYISTLSHLRRINTAIEKSGKLVQPRKLHPTQWGVICPSETPEGASVGLVKNLALLASVTVATPADPVRRAVSELGLVDAAAGVTPVQLFSPVGSARVFINGDLLGAHRDPPKLYTELKRLKRSGALSVFTSIVWHVTAGEIVMCTEGGRFVRPLLVVQDDGRLALTEPMAKALVEGSLSWSDLVLRGAVEYLDVDETNTAMVAMTLDDLRSPGAPRYTHMEVDPCVMLGVVAGSIPFADHNQAPRNTYQCLWVGEPVLMADGSCRLISDLQEGDAVITFDLATLCTSKTTVVHQFVRPTDKVVYELVTHSGRTLRATQDHKIMTESGWCAVEDIVPEETRIAVHPYSKPVARALADTVLVERTPSNAAHKDGPLERVLPIIASSPATAVLARLCGAVAAGAPEELDAAGLSEFDEDLRLVGLITPSDGPLPEGRRVACLALSDLLAHGAHGGGAPEWVLGSASAEAKREFVAGLLGAGRGPGAGAGAGDVAPGEIRPDLTWEPLHTHDRFTPQMLHDVAALLVSLGVPAFAGAAGPACSLQVPSGNLAELSAVVGYRYNWARALRCALRAEYIAHAGIASAGALLLDGGWNMRVDGVIARHELGATPADICREVGLSEHTVDALLIAYREGRPVGGRRQGQGKHWTALAAARGHMLLLPVMRRSELPECRVVADITVESDNHSFIGGHGFAVSNSAMGKQAIGVYASNFRHRLDTMAHVLNYAQRPLVTTQTARVVNCDKLPCGINTTVAIACFTGFNQEDSVIVNRSAVDRGFLMSTFYRTFREQNNKNHSTGEEEFFCRPDPLTTRNLKPHNYNKLTADGFAPENTHVSAGDVIIGKCMPQKQGSAIINKDTSVVLKSNERGFVDRNCYGDRHFTNVTGDGYTFAKVRLRNERVPSIGDKVSSRHGQKGTIGMLYREDDMPFTANGIVPSLIMNPHAIPSRMTIGQLMEALESKVCAVTGRDGDATPFNCRTVEDIASELQAHGIERYGNEVMYNPRSGEQVPCSVFVAPTYYQRLKHMVEDKVHCLTADHDVLTARGWVPIAHVTTSDAVATLHDGTRLVYERPLEALAFPDFRGPMYRVSNSAIDLDVTIDHRMFVSAPSGHGKAWQPHSLVPASQLVGRHVRYCRDAAWDAPDHQFVLPAVESKFIYPARELPMDAWLDFFGIWMAEGCVVQPSSSSSHAVTVALHKPRVQAVLQPAIEAMGFSWQANDNCVRIHDEQLYCHLRPMSLGAPQKRLPKWVWRLSAPQARRLMDAMILGDGTWRGTSASYYTGSDGLADDFSRLALHAGVSATKYLHTRAGQETRTEKDGRLIHTKHDVWRLSILTARNAPSVNHGHSQATQVEEVYEGAAPVYCLRVPSEVFYVRRNGKPAWTGNSRGANGPVVLLTRQPAEGRARDGGLRLGEMELECMWAHGSLYFLKERFMECSDNYRVFVCKHCGMMSQVNPERGIYYCRACKNITHFSELRIPYASKLLLQEVQTMGIGARFITD